jgi:thioredoxin-like negative regulator of GroEL
MFKPEWSKIVSELSNQHGLNIAQVEHGNYGLIPEHLRMNAFPTIQIIRFGHPTASFMGTRTLSNVVKFAKQHAEKKVATKKKVEPKSVLKDKKKKRPIHAIGERRRKRVV